MAKCTMIRESYDGDMTCYFPHDETGAGDTLEKIHSAVQAALQDEYDVELKPSVLRIREKSTTCVDLHIDVVPGRYVNGNNGDVFLHRTSGDKTRIKTNLQTHIDHIKDSKVTDAIQLMKLWKIRNGLLSTKTFVLELLVVKILDGMDSSSLADQLVTVWTELANNANDLSVTDPANSNNDLASILDQ